MEPSETLIVTRGDLGRIVEEVGGDRLLDELIASLAAALAHYDDAQTQVVKRHGFTYAHPHPGVLEWMPVLTVGCQALMKVVAYNPSNPGTRGIPTIVSTISVYDVATGHLIALMDGILPTALRTGAASAVATRILARPERSVLGLVGCGAQAVTQLHAISRVLEVERVLAHDTDLDASGSFAERVSFLGLPVEVVPCEVIARESDVICTATSAEVGSGPVIDDRQFKPWVHVNAVGSDLPGKTELSRAFLRRSLVCPDFLEQALVEGESQQLEPTDLGPPLTELVRRADEFESHRARSTVFDSTGFAVEDLVIAELFLRYASDMRLGRRMRIEGVEDDPRDPYSNLDLDPVLAASAHTGLSRSAS